MDLQNVASSEEADELEEMTVRKSVFPCQEVGFSCYKEA